MPAGVDKVKSEAGYEGIIGQEVPVRILSHLCRSGKLPGTFLFSGPGSVGKLATAIQFSKNLLCEKNCEPLCGCYSCHAVRTGSHPDIIVISRDSVIKVEEMRELVSIAGMKTCTGHHRVIILDNAENITREASNAALKTLEEPGERLRFILITDTPASLLPTVRSRSYNLGFKLLSKEAMSEFAGVIGENPDSDIAAKGIAFSSGRPGMLLKWFWYEGFREIIGEMGSWIDETVGRGSVSVIDAIAWKEKFREYAEIISDTERSGKIPRGANAVEINKYHSDAYQFPLNAVNWKVDQRGTSRWGQGRRALALAGLVRRLLSRDMNDRSVKSLVILQDFMEKIRFNCNFDIALERLYFQLAGVDHREQHERTTAFAIH